MARFTVSLYDANNPDREIAPDWEMCNQPLTSFIPLSFPGWQQRKRRHKGTLDTRVSITGEGRGWPD